MSHPFLCAASTQEPGVCAILYYVIPHALGALEELAGPFDSAVPQLRAKIRDGRNDFSRQPSEPFHIPEKSIYPSLDKSTKPFDGLEPQITEERQPIKDSTSMRSSATSTACPEAGEGMSFPEA